jgi:segregation and condensation protein A
VAAPPADDPSGPAPEQPEAAPADAGTAPEQTAADPARDGPEDIYRVELDVFEGPLDLLLHLIQKHELDIFDIPISFVTKKYLEYLDWMGKLQIDVASEYLVMAATLAYIKSRMLLPDDPGEGEDEEGIEIEDPRAELVRRLLEYQKYRDAAAQLGGRAILDRDVFTRGDGEAAPSDPAPFAPVSVFKLFEAFDDVLRRAKQTIDHEVMFERISIAERMVELTELLHDRGRMRFEEFFEVGSSGGHEGGEPPTTFSLVITFLAMLEMARLGVAQVTQEGALGDLVVEFAKRDATLPAKPTAEGAEPNGAEVNVSPTGEPHPPAEPSLKELAGLTEPELEPPPQDAGSSEPAATPPAGEPADDDGSAKPESSR